MKGHSLSYLKLYLNGYARETGSTILQTNKTRNTLFELK